MTDATLALMFWIVVGLGTVVVLLTLAILLHDVYREHRDRVPHQTGINDRLRSLK